MEKKDERINVPVKLVGGMKYLSNLSVGFSEEEAVIVLDSGEKRYRFVATPKHLKRIYLYFREVLDDYEKKFGPLQTQLPQMKNFLSDQDKQPR